MIPSPTELASPPRQAFSSGKTTRGFSLIELMVVLVIAIGLMAIVAPSLTSLMESSHLAQGGQLVADQINLARQIASTKNSAVEIRVIKFPAGISGYTGIQLWGHDSSGNLEAVSKIQLLPSGAVISENPTASEALVELPTGTMTVQGESVDYVWFQIRPSAVVSPATSMSSLFLTVVSPRHATDETLPDNYMTIQINPVTATAFSYRP